MPSQKPKQGGCCGCSCIISWGLTAFLLYYYIHASTPTFSIEQFDVFSLKESNNQNNTISYDMKLKNRNFNKGIYYDDLNLNFYYKPNLSTYPIGSATFSSFYQGHNKATHRGGTVVKPISVQVQNSTSLVVFRVEVATAIRYKSTLWKSGRHHMVVGADLQVNGQGSLIKEKGDKGIKLKSSAWKTSQSSFELMGMLGILIFTHFWLIWI